MAKSYDPTIAARINKETYNYLRDLSKRRAESMSTIINVAIREYVEKCKRIEESLDDQF
jgi:predicted DNA-binding protein